MKTMNIIWKLILFGLFVFPFLLACSSNGDLPQSKVSIQFQSRDAVSGAVQNTNLAGTRAVPSEVTDITILAYDKAVSTDAIIFAQTYPVGVATIDFLVDAGPQRIFVAQGLDRSGGIRYQGISAPVDLEPNGSASVGIVMVKQQTSLRIELVKDPNAPGGTFNPNALDPNGVQISILTASSSVFDPNTNVQFTCSTTGDIDLTVPGTVYTPQTVIVPANSFMIIFVREYNTIGPKSIKHLGAAVKTNLVPSDPNAVAIINMNNCYDPNSPTACNCQ